MKEVEHRTCYRILLFPIGSHVLIGALLKILCQWKMDQRREYSYQQNELVRTAF